MGRFLIWLSGARRQILRECPTERPKYVGIGASILITAAMAAVSLAFALVTALRVEFWLTMPFAIAWGLAILSLDRLFVVSLSRNGTWLAQLLRATPRVLLALLLGFVISTPFVLQIFRPEIEHEITILHTQAENAYLAGAKNSSLQQQINRDQEQVNRLTAAAGGGGPLPQSPQLQSTLDRLNQAKAAMTSDYNQWQCQLYGPCQPTGNGPLAMADQQRYDSDVVQVKQLTSTANAEQNQLDKNISSIQAKNKTDAEARLPLAQKVLQAAQTEQAQELSTFTTQNENNGGLLIRLQALGAVTSHDSTLNAARWLLFLLFVVIDCMPVMIKVMLNLGPENNYDRLLQAEEEKQLRVAANIRVLREAAETTIAETVIGEAQNTLVAWNAAIPELTPNIVATRTRVGAKKLDAWENAQTRQLIDQYAAPRRWWHLAWLHSLRPRRRSDGSQSQGADASDQQPMTAPSPLDTTQSAKFGNSDKPIQTEQPEGRRDGESTSNRLWKAANVLTVGVLIPVAIGAASFGLGMWQSHIATQQNLDGTMETYLSDMRDFVLNQHLSTSDPGGEVRNLAKEKTVTTLKLLDAHRNAIVLRFLRDAGLIGPQDEVIDLSGADLTGADLNGVNLAGVTMDGANLTNAHLSGATLTGASLSDAILTGADLTGARLGGAILTSADLTSAHLSKAILAGADLSGAKISQQQFDEVNSCRDAIPPAEVKCNRAPIVWLTYWYTETDQEKGVIIRKLIPQFEHDNPGIRIMPKLHNFFDTRAAFEAAVQDGKPPDVLRADLSWIQLFAQEGYLLNIDSYAYQDQIDLNLSDYRRLHPPFGSDLRPTRKGFSPLTYDEYNGHLYGLPQVTDVQALLYNKKELKDAGISGPPRNMTEFEADVARVVQQKKAEYGFETDGTFAKALPFLYACGGGVLDQRNNNIMLNDNESISGLNFLLHLRSMDNMKPMNVNLANGGRVSPIVQDFEDGRTAMIFDGPYDVPDILTGSKFSGKNNNLGIAGIPRGSTGQTGSPLGGQSYVIYSGTAYPAEAYKFIEFMSSENSQVKIAEANYTLPTRWSATNIAVSSNSFIKQFQGIWKTEAVARPVMPKAAYLFDVADPSIRAALISKQTTDQSLNTIADQALNTIANSWNQLGAGNEISQPALTPGASQTACA